VTKLTSLRIAGWKSIREAEIEFRPLNVLIGGNGSGKSNLVSFFKMVNEMIAGRLQVYVATAGGADALLHYGSKRTPAFQAKLSFPTDQGPIEFSWGLMTVAGSNSLVLEQHLLEFPHNGGRHRHASLAGFSETKLRADSAHAEERFVHRWLTRCQVYHFHDTSLLGPMRQDCLIDANRFLYSDGGNLPAMLYLYRQRYPTAYRRIVAAVKAAAPFFDDFVLEPLRLNPKNIALHWRSKESEYEFGPHQLSDGTLRAVALFTLLLQPEEDLPEMIVLDEPELGLHPAALSVLADLLKSTARHSQLLIATQSAALIGHFEADDVVTVNLRDGASTFERLDPERLKEWLHEYTLSELWERNVIGGGPY
jgi:predicted ATPase